MLSQQPPLQVVIADLAHIPPRQFGEINHLYSIAFHP